MSPPPPQHLDKFGLKKEKVECSTITITNENSDDEVDIDQCKEDLAKIERVLFDLHVKQDTIVPLLCDFIEEWI